MTYNSVYWTSTNQGNDLADHFCYAISYHNDDDGGYGRVGQLRDKDTRVRAIYRVSY